MSRFFFFFKQKTAYEMRISDGVQTCALPISLPGGGNAVIVIDASGNHLLRAPTLSANAAVNYTIPVGEGSLDLNVNYSYSSKSYQEVSEVLFVSPIHLINAQMSRQITDRHRISVWGRNLTRTEERRVGKECDSRCR